MKIYIDGKFYDKEDTKISVLDHKLLNGDGLFEGIRVCDDCIFKLDAHLEHLERSAQALSLDLPWKREEISNAIVEVCKINELKDCYIRTIVMTRGIGDLGLNPQNCGKPSLIIIADKIKHISAIFPPPHANEIKLIIVPASHISVAALPPMANSLNYLNCLNSILAKIKASNGDCDKCLLLNDEGYVLECPGDNIFTICDGTLCTPAPASDLLPSITRAAIIECAQELGIPVDETMMTQRNLWNTDEAFFTAPTAEAFYVVKIDGRKIGKGTPGEITKKLLNLFREKLRTDGMKIPYSKEDLIRTLDRGPKLLLPNE